MQTQRIPRLLNQNHQMMTAVEGLLLHPPPPSQPSRDSPRPDSPGHGHPDEHPDANADEDLPYMSDDGPEYECEGLGTMSSHLAKLDSLSARGCADKFFQVHTARWGKSMPRPGDLLHSARAGGEDVRQVRKRRAENITRIAAESHAFCTSSNLSQRRCDSVLETFTNVSTFKFKLCLKFCLRLDPRPRLRLVRAPLVETS